MSKSETPRAKKNQVYVANELKFESNKVEEAAAEVQKLQKEATPSITLVNHVAQVTHLYKKERYDKNYKITKGVYPMEFPVAVQETV
ncbi:hypothetical protein LXD69_10075 [Flavobacterium sediminilitoris]|uniref:Uncharacterized protein n=1 Tax=Flavobacterium sediminilitoris TaxID=2024526 RepID=A0ABY4HHS9_9FLAO|nr:MULTISPECIES: hypothetical protein [Flavobacterium]UOX32399.1 hypothetical protein LXD69_10075 [Flavobacterium sediminilitoris]